MKPIEVWYDKFNNFNLKSVTILFKKEYFDSFKCFSGYVLYLENNPENRKLAEIIEKENSNIY